MKNDVKKYTCKDWQNKTISNVDVKRLVKQAWWNRGHGENKPYMPESEFEKIKHIRKQAFDHAVEITATSRIRQARKKINDGSLKNPENWLNLQIKKTEKFIHEHHELETKYEEDDREEGAMTIEDVNRIDGMYNAFKESDNYVGYANFTHENHFLVGMYINKLYLDELNKILKEITESGLGSIKNEEPSGEIGRPPEYNKQVAIDYFDKNKKELISLWYKYGGKTNVAEKILLKAYKNKKKPHPQTVVGYIEDYLSTNSEK